MITKFCSSASSGQDNEVCARILSVMEKDDIVKIFDGTEIPVVSTLQLLLFALESFSSPCIICVY